MASGLVAVVFLLQDTCAVEVRSAAPFGLFVGEMDALAGLLNHSISRSLFHPGNKRTCCCVISRLSRQIATYKSVAVAVEPLAIGVSLF